MICIKNLSVKKRYSKSVNEPIWFLKNINLHFSENETVVLFGEEGSGIYDLFNLFNAINLKKYIVEIEGVDKTKEWKKLLLNTNNSSSSKSNKNDNRFQKSIFIDLESSFQNTYLKPKVIIKKWFKKKLTIEKLKTLKKILDQFNLDSSLIDTYFFQMSNKVAKFVYLFVSILLEIDYIFIMNVNTNEDIHLINTIKQLNKKLGYILFTNNLAAINLGSMAYIFYAGVILEKGKPLELFFYPQHPYLWDLIISFSSKDYNDKNQYNTYLTKYAISTKGDPYASRNRFVTNLDFEIAPPFYKLSQTHYAKTHLLNKDIIGTYDPPIEIKKRWEIFKSMKYEQQ